MLDREAIDAFERGDDETLRRVLELRPWQPSPLDVDDGPSPWGVGSAGALYWPAAQKLRRELLAAVAARKKGARK